MLGNQLTKPKEDNDNPGQGGTNNPPPGGKQNQDSQTSSNGGAAAGTTETVVCNCGNSSEPTGVIGGTIPPAPSVTTQDFSPIDASEIELMRNNQRYRFKYLVKVCEQWKELPFEDSCDEKTGTFRDGNKFVDVPYAAVYQHS